MKVGDRVRLASMLGTTSPPSDVEAHENYWKLIGEAGQLLEEGTENDFLGRFLVRFDENVTSLGLECHNPIPNTLWILSTDLEAKGVSKSD
ncbi:hypothetical protein [Maritalea porphyrae]|uniref:Uncharacterized protein n=1 Tax=Maritalea porphyrae TaxID=880732 RepID=A0ABQ5USB5_9HYPH|nr:hypothetical protein [Maritalea porphyrae]GLQ18001.1 hypothetical protein GCM10007879_22500 [Maritalea porphyrae]